MSLKIYNNLPNEELERLNIEHGFIPTEQEARQTAAQLILP
jgi:hypothetical protein